MENKYTFDNDALTERIKQLKDSCSMTRKDFAKVLGITDETAKKRLQGINPWTVENLIDICNYYECDLDYLLGVIEEKKQRTSDLKKLTRLSEEACDKLLDCCTTRKFRRSNELIKTLFGNIMNPLSIYDKEIDEKNRLNGFTKFFSWMIENGLLADLETIGRNMYVWGKKHDVPILFNGDLESYYRHYDELQGMDDVEQYQLLFENQIAKEHITTLINQYVFDESEG